MLRVNERGSMRSQQWKATTMNNNIEVMKLVLRRVKRPSAATLQTIKTKAELEARVTLRYMALLAAILTMPQPTTESAIIRRVPEMSSQ